MDRHTLELLEFDRFLEITAHYAASRLGKDAVSRIEPSTDPAWIRDEQSLTTEMVEAISAGLTPPFGGLRDIREAVRRARVEAVLTAEELAEIVTVLRAVGNLRSWLTRIGESFDGLGRLVLGVFEFGGLTNAIESCLDARGKVLDTASRRLASIRREMGEVEGQIHETLRAMLRSSDIRRILRYPNFTMVGHHYVLPIAREQRGEIQGAVHRTSASNETVYVEPLAIAERSAQLSYLRSREEKEIRRILRWLSAQVGLVADALLASLETLAHLDVIHARARYSLDSNMSPPDLNEEAKVVLQGARHPLLEHVFRQEAIDAAGRESPHPRREVVPIDLHLGLRARLLVITGPNTGGKTVALKTLGLLALMAQSGFHIPARRGSRLPIFDDVLCDIGDEQSIEQSLSTFSSHVRRIAEILGKLSKRSLVLLDETGAGTDPVEGAALGRSVLDELDSAGCLAMVTTHLGDLKSYAFDNPRAENAAVEFDIESLRPLYRLRIGDVGQSNALRIARRLNLPEHVVSRAEGYLERSRPEGLAEWDIVAKLKLEAEQAHTKAIEAQSEAERSRDALRQRLADLQAQSEHDERLVEARGRLRPGDRVVVPRFGYDRPGRVVKLDPRRQSALVAIGNMQWDVKIDELIPQIIKALPAGEAGPGKSTVGSASRGAPQIDDLDDG
jgi:DNA mismatch repair protein MutS2